MDIDGFWEDGIYWGNVGWGDKPVYTAFADEENYLDVVNDPEFDPFDYIWN